MKNKKLKNISSKKDKSNHQKQPSNKDNKKNYPAWIGIAIIILLGIIIYSNSFNCSFQLDDTSSIVDNQVIRDVTDFNSIWKFSQSRFIPYLSLAANYHFGELNVWGYHFVNLLIHITVSLFVYWLSFLILKTPNLKDLIQKKDHHLVAFITALLFVSHPLATQSVTYIVQRMASIVAMFYLLTLILYLKGRLNEGARSLSILYFGCALIAAIFALFSKENAYTLPLAFILLEIFFLQKEKIKINFKDTRIKLAVVACVCFLVLLFSRISLSIFNPISPGLGNSFTVTPLNYFFTQFIVIVKYIQLLILPIGLNIDHDIPIASSLIEIRTLLSLFFLLAIVGLAIYLFNRQRIISFAIFWFFLTISIESSFIPLADLIFEHRTYLPSFGFFLILSVGLYKLLWQKNRNLAIGILLVIIGSNSFLSFERNKVWKNNFTLWNDAVSKSPNKARPLGTRGDYYRDVNEWDKAITDYTKALRINPRYTTALHNRGFAYAKLGDSNKAIEDYNNAIKIRPTYSIALLSRGIALYQLSQLDNALKDYSSAIKSNPKFSQAYFARSLIYSRQNQLEKAIADCNSAIKYKPTFSGAYFNRGYIYSQLDQFNEAIADYSKAIEFDPNNAKIFYNRGEAYGRQGQWNKAIADYDQAIALNPSLSKASEQKAIAIRNLSNK